jgi:hypothetical protein
VRSRVEQGSHHNYLNQAGTEYKELRCVNQGFGTSAWRQVKRSGAFYDSTGWDKAPKLARVEQRER